MEEELEFTAGQEAQLDAIYKAIFEVAKIMTHKQDLEFSVGLVDECAWSYAEFLYVQGYDVHYPVKIYNDDNGKNEISEFMIHKRKN